MTTARAQVMGEASAKNSPQPTAGRYCTRTEMSLTGVTGTSW